MNTKTRDEQHDPIFTEARRLWKLGFAVLWLYERSKKPIGAGWTSGPRRDWKHLKKTYREGYNVGVRTGEPSKLSNGHLACIDVDVKKPEAQATAYAKLKELIGDGDDFPSVASGRGNGSKHVYCATSKPFPMITVEKHEDWEICIYSTGRQMVLPPSIHPDTGRAYKWLRKPSLFPLMDFSKWEKATKKGKVKSTEDNAASPAETLPEFMVKDIDIHSIPLPEKMRQLITECTDPQTGEKIKDHSAFLLTASNALYDAGLDRDEVLSVLSDRRYLLGKCAYKHTGSDDRKTSMRWLWRYTVKKIENQHSQKTRSENQATRLTAIADEKAQLFHTPDDEGYASVEIDGHTETYGIKSQQFRKWLIHEFRRRHNKSVPGNQAIQDALTAIGSNAQCEGERKEIHLRIAKHEGRIYVDLCNPEWEAVEIDTDGWRVVKNPPVKFRRTSGMLPLPQPMSSDSESRKELQNTLNIESDPDFRLVIAWLMSCFNPNGPYLILVLYAEQGSGKSTLLKMLRDLVDPNVSPLRREPRNTDDLLVSAKSNWIIAIDNMSFLPDWLSDDFCRLATGGGLSKRAQYTNDEEFVLNAKRPIILNGIDEFIVRGDLASRSIVLHLPAISNEARKREEVLWEEFNNARPKFLGLLFYGISMALRKQDTFELATQFRMADAWHWATASEPAFQWKHGAISRAYQRNQLEANTVVLDSSPLYPYIRKISENDNGWDGTAEELLRRLDQLHDFDCKIGIEKGWPKTPKVLRDKITRLAPALRLDGIGITFYQTPGSNSQKRITLRKLRVSCDANDAKTSEPRDNGDAGVAKKHRKSNDEHAPGIDLP